MGSEMCIRDRHLGAADPGVSRERESRVIAASGDDDLGAILDQSCLLYTSDAADERSSVDLGGRRIIKKKKTRITRGRSTRIHKHRAKSQNRRTLQQR